MMGLGKQEGDTLGPKHTPPAPTCPDGEGSPRATRGQSSPIFIIISLNHHPMPVIKTKMDFLLLFFFFLLPPFHPLRRGQ